MYHVHLEHTSLPRLQGIASYVIQDIIVKALEQLQRLGIVRLGTTVLQEVLTLLPSSALRTTIVTVGLPHLQPVIVDGGLILDHHLPLTAVHMVMMLENEAVVICL